MSLGRRYQRLRAALFVGSAIFAALTAAGSGSNGTMDAILQRLRPEQRGLVIFATRQGEPRVIAYEPVRVIASRPKRPAVVPPIARVALAPKKPKPKPVAIAKPSQGSPKPTAAAFVVGLAGPRLPAEPVATRRPAAAPAKSAPNAAPAKPARIAAPPRLGPAVASNANRSPAVPAAIAYVPRPEPSTIDVLTGDGRTFVPTASSAKPALRPTPGPVGHDLAWLYAHRFDTPGPDDVQIPGVPVRSQVASPFDINSGAFHGVRSTNGWSALRASVSIPCGAAHFVTGPGYNEITRQNGIVDQETGYINVGGWGAGPHGVAVDAGLQKASAQANHDDYAFYFKYASNKPITSDIRFPCGGPDVVLELYAVTDTLLVFSATGMTDQHRHMTLTLVQQTRPSDGWTPGGGGASDGIILKRIVAIAQPASWHQFWGLLHRDRFSDGSYFGVDGPNDQTPRIKWRSCQVGHVVPPAIIPRYQPWTDTQTWTPSTPGTYTNWPPADVIRESVGGCDAAGIALRR